MSRQKALSGILLVIPTLNEADAIAGVLADAKRLRVPTVVVDGGSEDETRNKVAASGIQLLQVPRGKGNAFRSFLARVSEVVDGCEYVALIDGDGTYDLADLVRLARCRSFDMVVGKRVPDPGALSPVRLLGNRMLNGVFSVLYGHPVPDLLSGFRLIRLSRLAAIPLDSAGFELETELTARFLRSGFTVGWVPVRYRPRKGTSKLHPVADGLRILGCLVRLRLSRQGDGVPRRGAALRARRGGGVPPVEAARSLRRGGRGVGQCA